MTKRAAQSRDAAGGCSYRPGGTDLKADFQKHDNIAKLRGVKASLKSQAEHEPDSRKKLRGSGSGAFGFIQ